MINKFRYILRNKFVRSSIEKNDIDMKQLKRKVKEGAVLVDTRSPQEYKEGHLEGSILIPEYELKLKAEEKLPNKEETIIVYCASGNRSKRAQKNLEKMGYINVYNLYGGLNEAE